MDRNRTLIALPLLLSSAALVVSAISGYGVFYLASGAPTRTLVRDETAALHVINLRLSSMAGATRFQKAEAVASVASDVCAKDSPACAMVSQQALRFALAALQSHEGDHVLLADPGPAVPRVPHQE